MFNGVRSSDLTSVTPPREFLFLVNAIDCKVSADRLSYLQSLLAEPLDWDFLRKLLSKHRVLALFVSNLRSIGLWKAVPVCERSVLERDLRANQLRQLGAIKELIEITEALRSKGLEVLCLKGPVLGVLLHKDPLLRHYSDLDLLVRCADIPRAVSVLIGQGFCLLDLKDIQSRTSTDPVWKHLYHVHLKRGSLHLELHWRLSRNDQLIGVSLDLLFAQKQAVVLGGSVLHTLGNRHLGDYIALHGASHCWNRLKWLHDAESHHRLNGGVAVGADIPRAFELGRRLCDYLWSGKPCDHLQRSQNTIEALCLHQIFSLEDYPRTLPNMYRRTRVLFVLYPSLRTKIAYLCGLLVWPQAYETVRFPRAFAFLYYFLGPILWAKSQFQMAAKKVKHGKL